MKAVDTNVLVRLLTQDDPAQGAIARERLSEPTFLPETVLIETEWVLRGRLGWSRTEVNRALRGLLALATTSVERPEMLAWALDRHERGADWADMLHLIAARHQQAFVTFDQALARRASEDAPVPVELLK